MTARPSRKEKKVELANGSNAADLTGMAKAKYARIITKFVSDLNATESNVPVLNEYALTAGETKTWNTLIDWQKGTFEGAAGHQDSTVYKNYAKDYDDYGTVGEGQEDETKFTDIENHWAEDYIKRAEKLHLFDGTSPTTFSPDVAMTRGMFVKVLGSLAKWIDTAAYAGKSKFADVKEEDYFCAYVNWAQKNGIVAGTSPTTFSPNENITREQTAVMLSNYMDYAKINLPESEVSAFADNDQISAYAGKAVQRMHATGLMVGRGDNMFVPQGESTRAEMATILVQFCDKIG